MSLEISVITDEISADFAHACGVCREHDLRAVEIRRIGGKRPHELRSSDWQALRGVLSDHRLHAVCIASAFAKAPLYDKRDSEVQLDILRRSADTARELDCPLIRGFAFLRTMFGPTDTDRLRRAYERVPDILAEWQVSLAVENEPGSNVETAEELGQFLDLFRLPTIGAAWDPANHWAATTGKSPSAEAMDPLLGRILHVHVKDMGMSVEDTPQARFLGHGKVDWADVLARLSESGYNGCLSLETQASLDGCPESLQARFRDIFNRDAPRETASRISLALLAGMTEGFR